MAHVWRMTAHGAVIASCRDEDKSDDPKRRTPATKTIWPRNSVRPAGGDWACLTAWRVLPRKLAKCRAWAALAKVPELARRYAGIFADQKTVLPEIDGWPRVKTFAQYAYGAGPYVAMTFFQTHHIWSREGKSVFVSPICIRFLRDCTKMTGKVAIPVTK